MIKVIKLYLSHAFKGKLMTYNYTDAKNSLICHYMYFLMNNILSIYEIKKPFYIALLFSYDLRTMWFNFLIILTMVLVNRPHQSVVYMTIFNDTIFGKLIENNMLRKIKTVLWQRIKKVFKYLKVKKN